MEKMAWKINLEGSGWKKDIELVLRENLSHYKVATGLWFTAVHTVAVALGHLDWMWSNTMTGMQPLSTLLLFNNSDSQPSTHYSAHEKELFEWSQCSSRSSHLSHLKFFWSCFECTSTPNYVQGLNTVKFEQHNLEMFSRYRLASSEVKLSFLLLQWGFKSIVISNCFVGANYCWGRAQLHSLLAQLIMGSQLALEF